MWWGFGRAQGGGKVIFCGGFVGENGGFGGFLGVFHQNGGLEAGGMRRPHFVARLLRARLVWMESN